MRKTLRGGALLLVAGLMASCSSAGSDSGAAPDFARDEVGATESQAVPGDADAGFAGDWQASSEAAAEQASIERQIVTTGSVYIRAKDPFETADEILDLVTDSGGFIEERSQRGSLDDGSAHAFLKVRVPADKASQTIADLEESAEVYEIETQKEDVTSDVIDVAARIEALEASVERLKTLLSEAKSSEALFEAEGALTQRQAELDSLKGIQRDLSDQVSLATLHISIDAERVYTSPPDGFMGGVEKGWNGLVATFLSLVTVFGVLTPWLIVLVPVAVVLIVLWRGRKRRHDRKAGTQIGKDGAASPSAAASSSAATKVGESTEE